MLYGKEWQVPIFSEAEGKRRHKKIRELMVFRGIDCLIIAGHTGNYKGQWADVRYVSNYNNWFDDEYCVFPLEAEPTLFVWAGQHEYWSAKVSWIKEIIGARRSFRGLTYVEDIVKKIKELGLERANLGIVSMRNMPAYTYAGLREHLPDAKFSEASDILRTCRLVMSDEELEFVRKAGECADRGLEAMAKAARPGVTEYELAAECERAMVISGAEVGSFSLVGSKKWPNGWGLTHGGTNKKLRAGDIIFNEITPCFGGYYVQLCRPISLGTPPDDFMKAAEVYREMYLLTRREYRAGNTIAEIDAKVSKFGLSKRNFSVATAAIQGTDSILTYPLYEGELKPGMVFVLHPWTNPSEAEMKAQKGHMGHIFGDTCIVTEGEAESVSRLPLDVTIV